MRFTKKDLDELVDHRLSELEVLNSSTVTIAVLGSIMQLVKDNSLMIKGFGTFDCKQAKAKVIPNIRNPEKTVNVRAHNRVYFRAGKAFKEYINEDSY